MNRLPTQGSRGILWKKPTIGDNVCAQQDGCLNLATGRLQIAHQ